MNILDNIYGVLFKPYQTFPKLTDRSIFSGSILIIIMLALINALKNSIVFDASNGSMWLLFIINVILYTLIWIMSGVFITFTADMFGGSGKISETMTGLAYSVLPLMFIAPLYMLFLPMGETGDNIYSLLKIVIFIWSLFLVVNSIKYVHKFHTTQAILSLISLIFLKLLFIMGLMIISILGAIFASSI
ncbi:MAG: YIP1 family protein [Candidatus Sericytochromatia bacterium]